MCPFFSILKEPFIVATPDSSSVHRGSDIVFASVQFGHHYCGKESKIKTEYRFSNVLRGKVKMFFLIDETIHPYINDMYVHNLRQNILD